MTVLDVLERCCEPCAKSVAVGRRLYGDNAGLVAFFADPLMGVALTDKGWVQKFEAAHPNRRRLVQR